MCYFMNINIEYPHDKILYHIQPEDYPVEYDEPYRESMFKTYPIKLYMADGFYSVVGRHYFEDKKWWKGESERNYKKCLHLYTNGYGI